MTKTSKIKNRVKSGVSRISSRKRNAVPGKGSGKDKTAAKMITLRGIDPALSQTIKSEAEKEHKSINRFLVDTLKKSLGVKKEKKFTRIFHDLDELFGKWSEKEFNQFQDLLQAQRTIDAELWR